MRSTLKTLCQGQTTRRRQCQAQTTLRTRDRLAPSLETLHWCPEQPGVKELLPSSCRNVLPLLRQSGAHPFNKGVLFNTAYRQSQRLANVTCWVMQDADLLPMDHRNLYRCADHPRHLCLTASQTHWPDKVKLKKSIYVRSRSEGLNTLNYTLLGLEARPLYTRLLIQVPPPPPSIYTTSTRQTRP
ncbi:hypothetical protein ACOMHN_006233 [Nucella lapillus]